MATIKQVDETNSLNEIMQVNDMRFAFVNPTEEVGHFQAVMVSVKCREYFNEFLMKNHHKENFHFIPTWGFNYLFDKYPLQMDATRIALYFKSPEQYNTFKDNLGFLHKIEDLNGFSRTKLHGVDSKTCVVEGDSAWISKCIMANIYTLILKQCTWNLAEVSLSKLAGTSEWDFVKILSVKNINKVYNNLKEFIRMDSKYVDGSNEDRGPGEIHGHSGLIAAFKNYGPNPLNTLLHTILNVKKFETVLEVQQ